MKVWQVLIVLAAYIALLRVNLSISTNQKLLLLSHISSACDVATAALAQQQQQ